MHLGEILFQIEQETGALINVDAIHPAFYALDHLQLTPDQHIHRSAFCVFAKRVAGQACFDAKDRSRERARSGKPVCAECPFGVREWMWPVMWEGELAATVYLGGFRGRGWKRVVNGVAFDGSAPEAMGKPVSDRLCEEGAFLATFIRKALTFWRDEGLGQGKHRTAAFYREFALQYIARNYQDNIQITDLARVLRVTPNFLSHRLRLACGKRFSEMLTEKRLENAAVQLEFHHKRDITEIAYLCGWRDSNYFSTVFRKKYGCSPSAYRQRCLRDA